MKIFKKLIKLVKSKSVSYNDIYTSKISNKNKYKNKLDLY